MAIVIDYLSYEGLKLYDASIKSFIDSKVAVVADETAKSFKYVTLADGVLKFYTTNPIEENAVADFEIELPEQDLSHLMALVDGAVAGNVATFGENGQVVDGGVALSNLATKAEVDAVAGDVDALDEKVGVVPEGSENVIEYVNKKAQEVLDAATGGSSESAASVKLQLDNYIAENDPKVAANATAAANAQAAAAAAQDYAEGVAGDLAEAVEALEAADEAQVGRIVTLEETILGLSGAMHFKGVVEVDPTTITEGYENGDTVIYGNKEFVWNNGAFVEFGDATGNAEAISGLTGRMTAAEEAIALKAAQADLEAEVAAREALDARVDATEDKAHTHENADELAKIADGDVAKWNAIEENATAYTDAEIAKVNDKIGEVTEGKTVVQLLAEAREACEAGKTQAIADANAYTDTEIAKVNTKIGEIAEGKTVLQLISEARSGAEATAAAYTDAEVAKVNDAITALSETHATDKEALENADNALSDRATELESKVAALESVEHVEITTEQIDALFPQA